MNFEISDMQTEKIPALEPGRLKPSNDLVTRIKGKVSFRERYMVEKHFQGRGAHG